MSEHCFSEKGHDNARVVEPKTVAQATGIMHLIIRTTRCCHRGFRSRFLLYFRVVYLYHSKSATLNYFLFPSLVVPAEVTLSFPVCGSCRLTKLPGISEDKTLRIKSIHYISRIYCSDMLGLIVFIMYI